MKKFKSIVLGLKNGEKFEVDYENVNFLDVYGVTERNFVYRNTKEFNKFKECKGIKLEIDKEANKDNSNEISDSLKIPFSSIKSDNELFNIEIVYDNEDSEKIYLKWDGDLRYSNYQSTYLSESGDLLINVTK